MCRIGGSATPIWSHAVAIPGVGQFPRLLEGQDGSAGEFPGLAPAIHMIFRPEDEHRFSIEYNVVPPLPGGKGEMHEARRLGGNFAAGNGHGDALAATPARGEHAATGMKHGNHAQSVPNAVAIPTAGAGWVLGLNCKRSGNGRKRVRHEDFPASRLKYEHMAVR